jgi:hypothetical protein
MSITTGGVACTHIILINKTIAIAVLFICISKKQNQLQYMPGFPNATNQLFRLPFYHQLTSHSTILAEKIPGTIA